MIILLTGASGFIGRRLARALRADGHTVIEARRNTDGVSGAVSADFTRDLDVRDWLPKLTGVDTVINAVGILRERGQETFEKVHTRAPQALFAACAAAGVRRVMQISALGADTGRSGYFASKRAADEYLSTLALDWTIVQPSLVFGRGGASARLFAMLASLPIIPLPGRGRQRVQPIHIDDLVEAIINLTGTAEASHARVALVGPEALTLREFLRRLRSSMRLPARGFLPIPMPLMRLGARVAGLSSRFLLDMETLAMLEAGNTADPAMTRRLLGHAPRPAENLVDADERAALLREARLSWLLPILRVSIALVWLWTGIVSLGLYPPQASYDLLARVGVSGALAPLFLYGAAILDIVFGAATLLMRRRRLLWLAQMGVIVGYTIIITAWLPEFWLHPYGPILKNLPLLACLWLLCALEEPRWNTSS